MTVPKILFAGLLLAGGVLGANRFEPNSVQPTVVYIVRHAEKIGESADADLSSAGRERAKVLEWMLHDVPLDAIYSTDVPRTTSTVAPIAHAKGLSVSLYKRSTGELAPIIRRQYRGKTLLICGHSDTIPSLLQELGVSIEEKVLEGFDNLFILGLTIDRSDGTTSASLQRLHYPGRR